MDKSNEKGKIRNRYAKLQPLVNRINGLQRPISATNYYRTKPYYEHTIESYAHQLQNDSGNLVLAHNNNMETKVMKKSIDVELRNSEMPMVLFDQSVLSPAKNAEIARKQKKHKHRNKEKLCCTTFLDLKTELVDILHCVLYVLWSPVAFFARLFLTLASSLASVLYSIVKLFAPRCTITSQENKALKLEDKKLEILNSITGNSPEEKQPLDFNTFVSKQSSNFDSEGCFVSQGVKNGVTNAQAQTENGKSQKDLQSLRKKFNLSLEMVDEMCGSLGIDGGNYFQHSSRHQDISSVELSSDCLSDKYSSRFLDYKDYRKRALRQYQNSASIAGKKTSLSTLRNPSFKGSKTVVNSKRSHIHSKNYFRKNEPRLLMKNPDLSDASEFSEKQLERIDPKNRSYMYDKHIDSKLESVHCDPSRTQADGKFNGLKKSSATSLNKLRKKRGEKFRPHVPPLPLRPTLQKKSSSEDERQSEAVTRKYDYTLSNDLKNDLAQNSNLQPAVDPHLQIKTKLEAYMCIEKQLLQQKKLQNHIIVPSSPNQCHAPKLVCERDADNKSPSFQRKSRFNAAENEATISRSSKNDSDLNEAERRDERKEETKTSESLSLGGEDKGLPEKLGQSFEGEKKTNGSGDLPTVRNSERSKKAEFTKPIDAKSKWIEMKKKFYGKDYARVKEQPDKLEAENLSTITSVSKLPAQKIFQYNMQVGRARQMGEEPPSAADIFLERKTTSPCLKGLRNSGPGSNLRRNELQCSKASVPKSRCLSQTQSLSQWPLGPSISSEAKKYCSLEEKPKPKPKPRTEGVLNLCKIQGDGKTPMMSFAQIPQRAGTRANSSVSSLDVRRDQVFQNGPRPLDWPSQAKNLPMKKANLIVDDYSDKIDSLIAFCQSPSVLRESNDKEFEQGNCKLFDEAAAAGDSS